MRETPSPIHTVAPLAAPKAEESPARSGQSLPSNPWQNNGKDTEWGSPAGGTGGGAAGSD